MWSPGSGAGKAEKSNRMGSEQGLRKRCRFSTEQDEITAIQLDHPERKSCIRPVCVSQRKYGGCLRRLIALREGVELVRHGLCALSFRKFCPVPPCREVGHVFTWVVEQLPKFLVDAFECCPAGDDGHRSRGKFG